MLGLKIIVSVEVRIVIKPFCSSCNVRAFISQFRRFWALCNFSGQEDNAPPPLPSPNVPVGLCQ